MCKVFSIPAFITFLYIANIYYKRIIIKSKTSKPTIKKDKNTTPNPVGAPIGNTNALKWTDEDINNLGTELVEWLLPKYEKKLVLVDKKNNEYKDRLIDVNRDNLTFDSFLLLHKRLNPGTITYLNNKTKKEESLEKSELFSQLKKLAKRLQLAKIDQGALTGELSAAYSCFYTKNVHGRKDKQDIEHGGNISNVPKADLSKLSSEELKKLSELLGKSNTD